MPRWKRQPKHVRMDGKVTGFSNTFKQKTENDRKTLRSPVHHEFDGFGCLTDNSFCCTVDKSDYVLASELKKKNTLWFTLKQCHWNIYVKTPATVNHCCSADPGQFLSFYFILRSAVAHLSKPWQIGCFSNRAAWFNQTRHQSPRGCGAAQFSIFFFSIGTNEKKEMRTGCLDNELRGEQTTAGATLGDRSHLTDGSQSVFSPKVPPINLPHSSSRCCLYSCIKKKTKTLKKKQKLTG